VTYIITLSNKLAFITITYSLCYVLFTLNRWKLNIAIDGWVQWFWFEYRIVFMTAAQRCFQSHKYLTNKMK